MAQTMKRIHKIRVEHIGDVADDQFFGIRAVAVVSFPIAEMHTLKCIELNDNRARYACECSSKDSLIQHLHSGGLYGISCEESIGYIRDIEAEQLHEISRVLHQIGFSKRAIAAAMREVEHAS